MTVKVAVKDIASQHTIRQQHNHHHSHLLGIQVHKHEISPPKKSLPALMIYKQLQGERGYQLLIFSLPNHFIPMLLAT